MTITSSDIKFRKSVVQTDTSANGGRKGTVEVVSGARHALFPRVTKSQRTAGIVRHRKEYYCNENGDDETAYGVLVYSMRPSNAGDRFYIAKGTQTDTQADFERKSDINTYASTRYAKTWTGVGELETALSGGETSVALTMEANDFQFPNAGYLYISDNTMVSQTIESDVNIGDSVTYSGGTWSKIAHTDDIDYPNGWCVASNEVLTKQDATNEEFLQISENHYSGEVLASGDGSDASLDLATLTNVTNGVCRQAGMLPVITAVCGGSERTVNVAADGTCSGYCSAGSLNMATGAWVTDITWTAAPDNLEDVYADYRENSFIYSGNVATVSLQEQVANAYSADGTTYGSGCVYEDEVKCTSDNWSETSVSGTYNEASYPVLMYNDGTVEDSWTLTFTGSATFTVSGAYYGSVGGTGNTGSDFSPVNADTGQPYFTISSSGWGGTWTSAESVSFDTHPAAVALLLCEEVPIGTGQEPNNLLPIGSYTE